MQIDQSCTCWKHLVQGTERADKAKPESRKAMPAFVTRMQFSMCRWAREGVFMERLLRPLSPASEHSPKEKRENFTEPFHSGELEGVEVVALG